MSWRLVHADAVEFLGTLPPASVDACVTDPPYGERAAKWDKHRPQACVVVDPYAGSATTAVVALRAGRLFVGCDSAAEYVAIGTRRIEADLPLWNARRCAICLSPAACVGAYEGAQEEAPACDTCCGHGNEDGYCRPIAP